jgi:two-component system sensor histidine kinase HydH
MKSVNLPNHSSFFAALLAWALFSLLAVFIIWSLRDRARLVRDNENERILNTLFTGLRDYDDFGSAIEGNPVLKERIAGFAVYSADYSILEQWGRVPPVFDPSLVENNPVRRFNRYVIPDRHSASVKFVLHNERDSGRRTGPGRTPESSGAASADGEEPPQRPHHRMNLWFNALGGGNYVYIDILHPSYWRTVTITGFMYPLSILALLALVFYIRRLYLHNIEYRERIDAQQNLVVLGTAASTLAHEIKNPLHSIKLQTEILKKILVPGENKETGNEEIARIEEEVDRLTGLTYRVNDYLRDAAGNPEPLNLYGIIEESSQRLCGISILKDSAPRDCAVSMDGERARSVFENIIRNALEADPQKRIEAAIRREGNYVTVTVKDRGRGIPEGNLEKVFDPFFTSKSTGTGIGLAISRRFIEAAGGTIGLENRREGGVTVRIKLPCAS